jgi:hypothetical protein
LVDDLLLLCRDQGIELDWQSDICRWRHSGGKWEEPIAASIRKSEFRAILARIATLCNERIPDSVSPYGGEGELSVGASPAAVFTVRLINTAAEQRLELMAQTEKPVDVGQVFVELTRRLVDRCRSANNPVGGVGMADQIQEVLIELDDLDRRLLQLYLEDHSTAEVARILGEDADVLRVRRSRLFKKLRSRLNEVLWLPE